MTYTFREKNYGNDICIPYLLNTSVKIDDMLSSNKVNSIKDVHVHNSSPKLLDSEEDKSEDEEEIIEERSYTNSLIIPSINISQHKGGKQKTSISNLKSELEYSNKKKDSFMQKIASSTNLIELPDNINIRCNSSTLQLNTKKSKQTSLISLKDNNPTSCNKSYQFDKCKCDGCNII